RVLVARVPETQAERKNVIGAIARVDALEADEGPGHKARADGEGDPESDLNGDEGGAQARPRPLPLALEPADGRGPQNFRQGGEREQDAPEERGSGGEGEAPTVDRGRRDPPQALRARRREAPERDSRDDD